MATIKYKDADGSLITVGAGLHTHSPESIGAATADHTHSPSSIGASASGHTHDGRYYTENEVDTKFDNLVGPTPVSEQISDHATVTASTSAAGHMSSSDKEKLDGIATGANKYTHPTTAGNKHIPSGGSSGQILRWSASGTAVWGNDNDTTYNNATTSAAGLMSATDKTNLNTVIAQLGGYTIKYAANSSSLPSDTKIITLVPRGK